MKEISLLFGGNSLNKTITPKIYEESGNPVPGQLLYMNEYPLLGDDNLMTEISLDAESAKIPYPNQNIIVKTPHQE